MRSSLFHILEILLTALISDPFQYEQRIITLWEKVKMMLSWGMILRAEKAFFLSRISLEEKGFDHNCQYFAFRMGGRVNIMVRWTTVLTVWG